MRTEFLNHIERVFAIYIGDIESITVDIFAGNRQAFKFTQSGATNIGQFIDVIGADIEHGSLFFLRESIQTHGKYHQLARTA